MARNFDHDRLTAEQLSAALDEAGLSPVDLEWLTGVGPKSVSSWLKPKGDPRRIEPPFWLTSWLSLYLLPGGADRARAVAESKILRDET